ncbi:RGS domain-containing protein [Reticulomyxa filosa]|uniref:RGS domain-containing protein n=1 Tax=Reticulomyxa filosa TaxID=46433 RepID=X6NN62_RETFI|nr:RGS domain-containing protein [Reticulomyxa filosa]|eukprot:ETO27154.1 RGS domain-containing protein [Reticulomyxa filosa]
MSSQNNNNNNNNDNDNSNNSSNDQNTSNSGIQRRNLSDLLRQLAARSSSAQGQGALTSNTQDDNQSTSTSSEDNAGQATSNEESSGNNNNNNNSNRNITSVMGWWNRFAAMEEEIVRTRQLDMVDRVNEETSNQDIITARDQLKQWIGTRIATSESDSKTEQRDPMDVLLGRPSRPHLPRNFYHMTAYVCVLCVVCVWNICIRIRKNQIFCFFFLRKPKHN